jgi:hypothetical protein
MAATCRLFTFSGLMTAPKASGSKDFSTDSVGLLKYPYAANETISATSSAASSASALSPEGVKVLLIQVQQGKAAHFEINPPSRSTAATVDSPIVTGDQIFMFGEGWTISLLEHELS